MHMHATVPDIVTATTTATVDPFDPVDKKSRFFHDAVSVEVPLCFFMYEFTMEVTLVDAETYTFTYSDRGVTRTDAFALLDIRSRNVSDVTNSKRDCAFATGDETLHSVYVPLDRDDVKYPVEIDINSQMPGDVVFTSNWSVQFASLVTSEVPTCFDRNSVKSVMGKTVLPARLDRSVNDWL